MSDSAVRVFSDLRLTDWLQRAVDDFGFSTLTPVQAATIPQFLNHKDVIVEAVTGSGKTIAFLIPILEILNRRTDPWKRHEIGAVILSPTRELALQTMDVLGKLLKHCEFQCCSWIGGRSSSNDIFHFNQHGGHIVVATPGRLLDLLENHPTKGKCDLRVSLKSLDVLVLDEADRLLEMGFEVTLTSILTYLPKQRRTGMFSATQTTELKQLIRAGMRNPVVIKVQEKQNLRTPTGLTSFYTIQTPEKKLDHLVSFLKSHRKEKHLLFFATCHCVTYFTTLLEKVFKKWTVLSLHRKMKKKRQSVFEEFSEVQNGVLVCTDVVARGIDWPDIDWVVQCDVPKTASVYVHRCGRTARMGGRSGRSLLYLMPHEEPYVQFIKRNQQVSLVAFDESTVSVSSDAVLGMSSRLKKMALEDKAVFEEGLRAFVSFIRAYGQHECNLICRVKDLNYSALAEQFGLLKLPKMPELKNLNLKNNNFKNDNFKNEDLKNEDLKYTFRESSVDVSTLQYKDKTREKQRNANLKNPPKKKLQKQKTTEAFSIAKAKRLHTKERRLVKQIQRKKKSEGFKEEELDELANDLRLIKKLRLKKISKDRFNKKFSCRDSEEEEEDVEEELMSE